MVKTTAPGLYPLLGLITWGDLAEFTIYRNRRHKIIWYPKSYPVANPTPYQLAARAAFTAASAAWRALSQAERDQWKLAAARASLCATGYNAYLHFSLNPDAAALATLARQTDTELTL